MSNRRSMLLLNGLHRLLLRVTGGRLGSRLGAMPVIELTTTGRRTGSARSVLLTVAARDGDSLVVVASRGGDDEHPAWYLNLVSDPNVAVRLPGRDVRAMVARVANPSERARLWPEVVRSYTGYAHYQARTSRTIPLVLLESTTSTRRPG
ncbi:MAG: nitroreductase/quinone reductase family protein [Microcella sp.]|uniref:nitroreductase/quinone reductase family protein n=1 Tax=Microcella sp. TaxID=1913979 RepID=UPI003315CD58